MRKRKNKIHLDRNELKELLIRNNIIARPSYCHDDYMFTSVSMPYPIKDKLDRVSKKLKVTRSHLIASLIREIKE